MILSLNIISLYLDDREVEELVLDDVEELWLVNKTVNCLLVLPQVLVRWTGSGTEV